MLLPQNLQVPLASDEPPAWLVDYDAIFRGKRAELEAEGAAAAAKREVDGDGPATLLLPQILQVPLTGDAPPAWLTDYDAAYRKKRAELEAEDEAAAEHRARVAAAAPKRTVYAGGEGKIYGPSIDRPIPAKVRRLIDIVKSKVSDDGAICVRVPSTQPRAFSRHTRQAPVPAGYVPVQWIAPSGAAASDEPPVPVLAPLAGLVASPSAGADRAGDGAEPGRAPPAGADSVEGIHSSPMVQEETAVGNTGKFSGPLQEGGAVCQAARHLRSSARVALPAVP